MCILGLAAEQVFGTGLKLGMKQQLLVLVERCCNWLA